MQWVLNQYLCVASTEGWDVVTIHLQQLDSNLLLSPGSELTGPPTRPAEWGSSRDQRGRPPRTPVEVQSQLAHFPRIATFEADTRNQYSSPSANWASRERRLDTFSCGKIESWTSKDPRSLLEISFFFVFCLFRLNGNYLNGGNVIGWWSLMATPAFGWIYVRKVILTTKPLAKNWVSALIPLIFGDRPSSHKTSCHCDANANYISSPNLMTGTLPGQLQLNSHQRC